MLNQILSTYKTFSDSQILKIEYFLTVEGDVNEKVCHVHMYSYNWDHDVFEYIVLIFKKVIFFNFREIKDCSSLNITDALLTNEDSVVVLDFFPHQFSDCVLEIDENSDFLIKAEKLELKR